MSNTNYDVVVAQEYQVNVNGKAEKRTKWRQVGVAWTAKSGNSLMFELFLIPGTRYLVSLKPKNKEQQIETSETDFESEDAPF